MTKREAEQAVIRAAVRYTDEWQLPGKVVWLEGNRSKLAMLIRACQRLTKKRRPA